MEIILGKTAGFCYGVKRAVEGAKKEIENSKGEKIYCLGEIVHNKQVVEDLEKKGIIFIENIEEALGKTIIRAHGVSQEVYENAKKNNIEIKDYTCPNVLKIHEISKQYSDDKYFVFLCGNKTHPENLGTISNCNKNSYIIENEENVKEALEVFKNSKIKKLLLISQTTYSVEKFKNIEETIKNNVSEEIEIVVKNTICMATKLRQKETKEISKKVDCMIIIGGVNSSNTKKLYEIAIKNCKNCLLVENSKNLQVELLRKYSKIGIMAGASTPYESIKEVIELI